MSKSMKELKAELEDDCRSPTVSPAIRENYFRAMGTYADDCTIMRWYGNLLTKPSPIISTGGKTDFYNIIGCTDVDDLAEHWGLKGDEFNCLKAIPGIALGSRHSGTDPLRDARKLQHYANRIVARLEKGKK